ncbi:response regulator transcription factor [Amycolatopsis japonica]
MTLSTATHEVLVLVATAGQESVRYRVVVPVESRNQPEVARQLDMFASHGVEIRTVPIELFERLWRPSGPPSTGPTQRELDLLMLLMNGYTDESAAARLGISERTVRRMVSDLMHRLSARSRFQAGAKAADRGWLIELAG